MDNDNTASPGASPNAPPAPPGANRTVRWLASSGIGPFCVWLWKPVAMPRVYVWMLWSVTLSSFFRDVFGWRW